MNDLWLVLAAKRRERKKAAKVTNLAQAAATAIAALDEIAQQEWHEPVGAFAREQAAVARRLAGLSKS